MLKFTTHLKEKVSGQRLVNALNKVADDWAEIAKMIRQEDKYASHVTENQKDENLKKDLASAEEIRRGEINDFTIWQRVNEELTGECIAFLPK